MVLRTATKDENVPGPRTSVTVGARINADLLWRMLRAPSISRMLNQKNIREAITVTS